MNRYITHLLLSCFTLAFTLSSCVESPTYINSSGRSYAGGNDNNNSDNGGGSSQDPVDKGESFDLRKKTTLTIQVSGGSSSERGEVPFLIFGENPFNSSVQRIESIQPIGGGYTDANGKLTTAVYPNPEMSKLYIVPSNGKYGAMQEVDIKDQSLTFTLSDNAAMALSEPVSENYYGTLAYEDLWPWNADFDFNDWVASYSYTLIKNTENKVCSVHIHIDPLACGTGFSNGFGIELPVLVSNVQEIKGASAEGGCSKLTMILFDKTNELFVYSKTGVASKTGFANVYSGLSFHSTREADIQITLKQAASFSIEEINPFIYCNQIRTKEVHLVNKAPTQMVDIRTLGMGNDYSVPASGLYYKNKKYIYPWAFDIPRMRKDSPNWRHPIEKSDLELQYVYPDVAKWLANQDEYRTWYDSNHSNVSTSLLFDPTLITD